MLALDPIGIIQPTKLRHIQTPDEETVPVFFPLLLKVMNCFRTKF